MAGSLLLDTNVVIALLAGDPAVRDSLSQAELTFLSSIALGELYYGALKSTQKEANSAKIEALAAKSVTATVVGEVKGPKIVGFTYKSKTRQRRRYGHRQRYTTLEITGIGASDAAGSDEGDDAATTEQD